MCGQHVEQHARVDGRGLQELLAEAAVELRDMAVQAPAQARPDGADQAVAVGVQAGGGERDENVAIDDPVRAEQLVGLDHARRGTGQVVLVGAEQPRVLGGLPRDQGTTRGLAAGGDPSHQRRHPLGHHPTARDVVGHEQRRRPAGHEIVDDHRD